MHDIYKLYKQKLLLFGVRGIFPLRKSILLWFFFTVKDPGAGRFVFVYARLKAITGT